MPMGVSSPFSGGPCRTMTAVAIAVQMQGGTQSIMEDLWAALADYLDRMHARQDVAFNDATVQFAITAEVSTRCYFAGGINWDLTVCSLN